MSDVGCRIFTTRMSDFYNSDVVFLQLGCRIFTTWMSDFHNFVVGFSTTQRAPTSFISYGFKSNCIYIWQKLSPQSVMSNN